jgi:phenylpropionate dioxygenase-like ring-hydroxylating dioxygenase large terminal subunit
LILRGLWYVALLGADLRPGRMVAKTLLGERLLIGRGRGSQIFALRDI